MKSLDFPLFPGRAGRKAGEEVISPRKGILPAWKVGPCQRSCSRDHGGDHLACSEQRAHHPPWHSAFRKGVPRTPGLSWNEGPKSRARRERVPKGPRVNWFS
jgi:hypothetical protein